MFKITHISAECFPVAKVGGLADVVGALPKYQSNLGLQASVIMPFYENKFTKTCEFKVKESAEVFLGNIPFRYEILEVINNPNIGFELLLIKILGLTDRENVYGYHDDAERFLSFQLAALDYINALENKPNVIHCHDHHTGFVPFLTSYTYKYEALKHIPTVLTIHNAQYQGDFGYDKHHYFPEYNNGYTGVLDWNGKINPLASAIKCAWRVTTVSPSYLNELQEKANGLEHLLAHETNKCLGILNGIDKEVWNTEKDQMLEANYSLKNLQEGRQGNKEWLCKEFNLNPDLPLVAFIGRFVYEKGSDLLPDVIENIFNNMNQKVSLLILGSGDPQTTNRLENLRERYEGKFNCHIGYNEKLSRIIYGGADFLLMPSRVEPCGLNQMYAMRYGMIPIVSKTGGLIDTVIDIDEGESGFGIVCHDINVHEISFAIQRAVDVYNNTDFFNTKRKQLMQIENGWEKSAQEYINMYKNLTNL